MEGRRPPRPQTPERGVPPGKTDAEIPYEFNSLVNAFHDALQRPTANKPLFLFLDALDQLTASNNVHSLSWLPARLSEHVRLVVSAASPSQSSTGVSPVISGESAPARSPGFSRSGVPEAQGSGPPEGGTTNPVNASSDPRAAVIAALTARLDAAQRITLCPLTTSDGEQMLTNWLADAHRTLQPAQRDAVLAAFAHEGSPLWLRTAAEEAARLASWQPIPSFASATQGLLGQVLDRLSREEEHGDRLVSRTLSYLACARHGLAEDEILDILSADPEVMADFRRRSPNSPKVDSLPVAVWVRLHGDLAFYLAERQTQGASLLGFYHRSFLEAVTARCLPSRDARQARHQHLADYFGKQDWFIAPGSGESRPAQGTISDPPNARKSSEFPRHLYGVADAADPERRQEPVWQPLADALCNLLLVEAKVRSGLVFELQEDYGFALRALPEAQAEVEQERQRQERVACWTKELITYAQAWSARLDRLARKEPVAEAEPKLPDPPAACRMWTDEEIVNECRRVLDQPTRLDRLTAFAGFVRAEGCPLLEFGQRPGFLLQHTWNYAPLGPVHDAAVRTTSGWSSPVLLRRWPPAATHNPRPALLSTLEGHCDQVFCVSVTPDGRRAVSASDDGTLRIWNLASGLCLRTVEGHPLGSRV